jgi:hypothetical protein
MFEINQNAIVQKKIIDDSVIYIIDNFYEDIEKILDFLLILEPEVWKQDQSPSNNLIHFEDKRHALISKHVVKVYDFLSNLCGQTTINERIQHSILTNFSRFKKCEFNDYQNNYWWPHQDSGYTAIIYLNREDLVSGTNLYENLNPNNEPPNYPEHYKPWRSKENYRLIETLKPKFNRMVLFDGFKFFHGMNICNDDYFNENYRMNQVLFFSP